MRNRHVRIKRHLIKSGLPLALAIAASHAAAVNFTWTGTTNNNWDTNSADLNWTTSWSNAGNRSLPNSATFNLASPTTVNVASNIDTGSITFTTGGWTVAPAGGVLAFGGSGTMSIVTTTGTDTVNAIIANGLGTGGGVTSLSKSGTGTLVLGALNTYSGQTTINAGTVQIAIANSLNVAGSMTVVGGATSDTAGTLDLNGLNQQLAKLSGGSGIVQGGVTNNLADTVSVLTVGGISSQFDGVLQDGLGQLGLTKIGSSTLTLTAQNTFSGGTNVTSGSLVIGSQGSLLNTAIWISTGGRFSVNRASGYDPASSSVAPHMVALVGGGLSVTADLDFAPFLAPSSGLLLVDCGATPYTAGGTNAINFSTLPGGANLRLSSSSGFVGTIDSAVILTPAASTGTLKFGGGGGKLTVNALLTDVGSTPTLVDVSGSSTIVLAAANTYSGLTTIGSNATVTVTNASSLGDPSVGTTLSGGTLNLQAASAEPVTVAGGTLNISANVSGTITQTSGTVSISASASSTINTSGGTTTIAAAISGPVTLTGTAATVNLNVAGSSLLTVNGSTLNVNAATSQVINVGGGTVNINAAATGPITVSSGVVRLATGGSIANLGLSIQAGILSLAVDADVTFMINPNSAGGLVAIDTGAGSPFTAGGTNHIDFSVIGSPGLRLGATVSGGSTIAPTTALVPDAVSHTLRFGGGSTALTYNGSITDVGSTPTAVDVTGAGATNLGGTSSYSGVTTVNGTLQVTSNGGLGAGTGSDADGTIVNTGGTLTTAAGVTLGNEKITVNGGSLNVATNGPLQINGSGTLRGTYGGVISGSGTITFGTSTLGGANTYTGASIIPSGATVTVSAGSSLGDAIAGTTINTGGMLNLNAAGAEPLTVVGGTVNLGAAQAGTILLNSGMVNVNVGSSGTVYLSTGSLYINAAGTINIIQSGGVTYLNDTASAFVGGLSISGGVLSRGSAAGTVAINPTLYVSGNSVIGTYGYTPQQTRFVGGITGSGQLTLSPDVSGNSPSGIINITGPVTFSGTLRTDGQVSSSPNAKNTLFSNMNTTGTLNFAGMSDITGSLHHVGNIMISGNLYLDGPSASVTNAVVNSGVLTINDNATFGHLILKSGTLTGSGILNAGATQLEWQGDTINFTGALSGVTSIEKTTTGYAVLQALPNYSGPINIQAGSIFLKQTGNTNPISITGNGAYLLLNTNNTSIPTYKTPLYLNNSNAGTYGAGLVLSSTASFAILAAPMDLGNVGSAIGAQPSTAGGYLTVSGTISGGSLTIRSGLSLEITAPATYTGTTLIAGNLLKLSGAGTIASLAPITLWQGAQLTLSNDVVSNSDRIPDATPIIMKGGTVTLTGPVAENLGAVTILQGSNSIVINGQPIGATSLSLASLSRNPGVTINFANNSGTLGGPLSTDPLLLISNQAVTPLLGGAYTVNNRDFAKYTSSGVAALTSADYFTGSESGWSASTIAAPAGSVTLTASRQVNAIKLTTGTLDLGSNTLNVISGGVFGSASITGASGNHLTAGGAAPSAELFLNRTGSVSANITDNPGPDGQYDSVHGGPLDADNGVVSLVISTGLTLSGNNTYSGTTYLNAGTLTLANAGAIGAGPFVLSNGTFNLNFNSTASVGDLTLHNGNIGLNNLGSLHAASFTVEAGQVGIPLTGTGPMVKNTDSTVTLANLSGFTGPITVNAGTLSFQLTPGQTFTNAVAVQSGTMQINLTTYSPTINWIGSVTVGDGGSLSVQGGNTNFAPASMAVSGNATLVIGGGNLWATGQADPFTDSADSSKHLSVSVAFTSSYLYIAGTRTISAVIGNGVVTTDTTTALSRLVITQPSQFNGAFQDGTGPLALTISTPGVVTLYKPSSYSGGTILAGGTFIVSNTTGSATGSGAVFLNSGTLGGQGIISGAVITSSAPHTIAPSATLPTFSTNTLTLGSLATNNFTTLAFNLVNPYLNDALSITSTNGLALAGGTITVNSTNDATSLGYYKIIKYAGTIQGSGIGSLTLPATSNNIAYSLDTMHDPGFIDLHRGYLGDANDDGFVDLTDLTTLAGNWQQHVTSWSQGDFNGDGIVDLTDLTILAGNWQTSISGFGQAAESTDSGNASFQTAVQSVVFATSVPEPTTLAFLGLGATGLLARRRRR